MLAFATEFLEQEDLDPQFKLEVLTTMWSQTSELLNAMLDALAATYSEARERLLQGAFASRVTTVREILDGAGDVDQSSGRLGYPLRLNHTAVVVWVADPAVFTGSLDGLTTRIAGGRRILSVPSGVHGVWSWIGHDDGGVWEPDPALIPAGVRLAVGVPASGIDGFRRSHREGRAAPGLWWPGGRTAFAHAARNATSTGR